MEISLAPETLFHLGPLAVSNSMLTAVAISAAMLLAGALLGRALNRIPGRAQAAVELVYGWLIDTADRTINDRRVSREVTPFILTLFTFILLSNWSGLLPGVGAIKVLGEHHGAEALVPLFRAPTSDLNTTLALALLSVGYIQYLGIKHAGAGEYIGRFLNFRSPIGFFVGLLEIIGELARVVSFSFRLFGNVFAGEVLITVMFFLTMTLLPAVAVLPLPFFFLELFVGLIQAFVFCFLTILFVSLAVASHGSGHEGKAHVSNR